MEGRKTVLVTGCSSEGGAGAALAREFRRRGLRVFATTRGGAETLGFLSDIGVEHVQLDVTSAASISAAVAHVRNATGGRLDILVNNAAVFSQMPLLDVSLQDDARAVFETNVWGVLAVTQAFLPLLVAPDSDSRTEKGSEKEGGLIVNVSSLSAIMCPPFQGVYAASKAALLALGHTMRLEFRPFGVRVVTVVSGGVDTTAASAAAAVTVTSSASDLQALPFSRKLREDSPYNSLVGITERSHDNGYKGMSPSRYAREVVDDLLGREGKSRGRGPKPMLWRGAFAWLAWLLTWCGWYGMMDRAQIRRSGLDRITYHRKEKEA